ncbi:MAG: tRNA (adenosine(37)-N6)-threonylcarbamoyltransferase complex ATPase subunit type 1 TsaE [Patescibacteria group bacterium]
MKKATCQIKTLADLDKLAINIIKNLKKHRLIALHGNLGSGKTALVKCLAKQLKIKKRITSPSFILMKIYDVPVNKYKIHGLCHADFYRAEKGCCSNLDEYIQDPHTLTIIEWPEKIKKLPKPRVDIYIKLLPDNSRKITIDPKSWSA